MINEYNFNDVLFAEKNRLLCRIQTIDILLGENLKPIKQDTKTKTQIEIPGSYNPNLTWESKCLFVINKNVSVYSAEIVDQLSKFEDNPDKKKIAKSISQALVKLKKANKIKTPITTGRKLNYEINI